MTDARFFPPGFLWGAATAAYQIEGAAHEGGRGASIWDTFSRTPGAVANGDTGDVATDHYHLYKQDVELISDLGLSAYRFSVSWPRIQPEGRGPANPEGMAFYDRLVDALLERGVAPALTLYHWDLPQALEDAGGWPARDTAYRFAEYAQIMHDRLGDRVDLWITLNEPWCSAFLGYAAGEHAPGRRDAGASLAAVHHLLLGHGLAVSAMRPGARPEEQFAITLNLSPVIPASQDPVDRAAAELFDGLANRLFLDPVLRGAYPQDVVSATRELTDWNFVRPGDEQLISAPIDLLGVNYYQPLRVAGDPQGSGSPEYPGTAGTRVLAPADPRTDMGWEINPQAFTELLTRLQADYGVPIIITENGASFDDVMLPDGRVADEGRAKFLVEHLGALHDAIREGVDVRGYFAWSLLDNFEWAHGYRRRFGVVYVDYQTQVRYPKDSALVLAQVARANAVN